MNPYESFISEIARLLDEAKSYPLGVARPAPGTKTAADAPRVLIFSPHPDDECIVGGLPLRLLRELGMRVVNVAVTLGSRTERRAERLEELTRACGYLGFELIRSGLEGINLDKREREPSLWEQAVRLVCEILEANNPRAVFFPHDDDGNSTHVGTHYLVADALKRQREDFSCHVFETEYWRQMRAPNLLVESSRQDVVDLVTALSFHAGEVKRNPYHLRLPAWMIDNVRRGSEIVCGQGESAPDFTFATIYRYSRWERGRVTSKDLGGGRVIYAASDLSALAGDDFTPREA